VKATQRTDPELHALILVGDEGALAEWEEGVRPDVLSMLAKKGCSPEDAEEIWRDAVIATWLRVQKETPLTPPGESLRRYAFGTAVRRNADRLDRQSRSIAASSLFDETDEPIDSERTSPESAMVGKLRDCLEAADQRVRLIAGLLMEQLSRQELASALGIAETSVGKYVQRTKKKLADCLEATAHE